MKRAMLISFALASLVAVAARAEIYTYEVESISNPLDLGTFGGDEAVANDVNDAGQVAGWARMSLGIPHAFLYRNGAMSDISGSLGLYPAYANGINNSGEVVGYFSLPGESGTEERAFYWHDSTQLLTLDAGEANPPSYSRAMAINGYGRIVGYSTDHGDGFEHTSPCAAEWDHAYAARQVGRCAFAQYSGARAYDVNNSGAHVGTIGIQPAAHAWISTGGQMLDPGANCVSEGFGINESGSVAGDAMCNSSGQWQAVLMKTASDVWLGTLPGGDESEAREVNDQTFVAGWSKGAFLGAGLSFAIRERGFIWHAHFGMKALPILPGTSSISANCRALALSNRSSSTQNIYAAGYCTNAAGKKRAVRWTIKVRQKSLPDTPPVQP